MNAFARQLYFELLKLFARKRTYFGFIAFFVIELVILLLLQTRGAHGMLLRAMRQHDLDLSHYFSGLTMAYEMMSFTVFLLGSLYVALVCGDIVSKEVEDGTMRMVLSRPVSRIRILLLKYVSCVIYTLILTLFIVASSLVLGIIDRGVGGLVVVAPLEHVFGFFEAGPGFRRFAISGGFLGFFMLTLASLGFMFSCFNMKPASATILTLSLYYFDMVLHNVPYFEDIRHYFLTYHMAMWTQVFNPDIPWTELIHSVFYLGVFDLIFVLIGALYFARRDFKS
jgi:ABC-2 type transport system permease protein